MALRRFAPHPVLRRLDVFVDRLDPRHDGVTIAHLSDVHCGRMTPRAHVRRAVELANAANPDVICMTGDYVNWSRREIPLMADQLSGLTATRVLLTLGNHDYFTSARRIIDGMERNGYEVLRNQNTTVEINGAPLHVVGVDDPVTRHHELGTSFRGLPRRGTTIALCHCPEQADALAERGADLVLSGHTHGGQIYMKGVTDVLIRRMGRRYRQGLYELGRSSLYVTPGVGFSGVRVRVGSGTRAEVGLLTLRRRPSRELRAAQVA